LVKGDNNRAYDVFMRDMTTGMTELISQRDPGVQSESGSGISSLSPPSISADGRWVAFASYAPDLIPNDTNNTSDVFVRDLMTGSIVLVSAGTDGLPALGGFSTSPVISGDGRFVAFVSTATNLVLGQTNLYANIFLRELQAGTNVLVSVSTNGVSPGDNDSSAPVISQEGRYVSFLSKARNLAVGLTGSGPNPFWRDVVAGLTASLARDATSSVGPSMSADGRFVASWLGTSQVRVWDSQLAANIYTNVTARFPVLSPSGAKLMLQDSSISGATRLVVRDLAAKSNLVALTNGLPLRIAAPWSADERFVAVVAAKQTHPYPATSNDVYLCDLSSGALTLISTNASHTGPALGGFSEWPSVSSDGRYVAYRSFATNLVLEPTPSPPNIFLFDRITGLNQFVSPARSVSGWSSWNSRPSFGGSTVFFQSWGGSASDLNRVQDLFALVLESDTDADGIPDSWLTQYFGHPTAQAGDQSRAQDDPDGDGLTNLQEYLAGTDPTNPASVLRVQITVDVSSVSAVLTWAAAPGRSYGVQYKDSLTDPVWIDAAGSVSISGGQGSIVVTPVQPSRYYRIIAGN
jgi:Tol biopolymer transport system component